MSHCSSSGSATMTSEASWDVFNVTSPPRFRLYSSSKGKRRYLPTLFPSVNKMNRLQAQPTQSYDLPSVADLKQAAESGQRITPEDVSVISQVESGLTGRGPIRGGPAGRHFPFGVWSSYCGS